MKKVGSPIRQLLPRRDVPLRQNARAQKLLLLLLADAACARLSAVEYERRRGSGQLAVSERTLLDRLCDHRLSGGLLRAAAHSGRYVGRCELLRFCLPRPTYSAVGL